MEARLEAMVEQAKVLCAEPDAGRALFELLREVAEAAIQKHDLLDELARSGVEAEPGKCEVSDELEHVFGVLLRRAQEAGAVRPDIQPADVGTLIMGTCVAADRRGATVEMCRLISVICDGLRAPVP